MRESEQATLLHIRRVQKLLQQVVENLLRRSRNHDESKLRDPEVDVFDEYTSKLKDLTYGSDEYAQCLAAMKPALDHHYAVNRHHPEHWEDGVKGMSLLDLIEMVCDWKAATERHADGDIQKSLDVSKERFGYSDEMDAILRRTVEELYPPSREQWHCFGCGAGGCTFNFCYQCGAGRKDYDATN